MSLGKVCCNTIHPLNFLNTVIRLMEINLFCVLWLQKGQQKFWMCGLLRLKPFRKPQDQSLCVTQI